MATKLSREGNFLFVVNTDTGRGNGYDKLLVERSDENANDNTIITLRHEGRIISSGTRLDYQDSAGNEFASFALLFEFINTNANFNVGGGGKQIDITSVSDFPDNLQSDVLYRIINSLDFTNTGKWINIPDSGVSITSLGPEVVTISGSDNNYSLFRYSDSYSGTLALSHVNISITGTNSRVYDLDNKGNSGSIESDFVNYTGCTSLGRIGNYRQGLEFNNGRFQGTPDLELFGVWDGYRISTSIVRNISNNTSLFQAGTGLIFSGRFIIDINCDLPAIGSLINLSDANITNDESLLFKDAFITRQGVINALDTQISPNISEDSIKSKWSANTGIKNTQKYIKINNTVEIETVIAAVDTYVPINGTFVVNQSSHFDSPSNGQIRLLSGFGEYAVSGDLVVDGTQNVELDVRVTKSEDDGLTFNTEVNHIKRVVNSLSGGRDVAFFPIDFIVDLNKNDRLRIEIENKVNSTNVTIEIDSYLIVSQI